MSVQIYKPNKSNSGCGFSFSMGYDKNNKEPVVFVSAILQHSWDSRVIEVHSWEARMIPIKI